MKQYLEISPDVQKAMAEKKPIVALESTIISHGMPYPQNFEMAQKVEQVILDQGAVPATIAIMDGKLKVGLTKDEINRLAQEGQKVAKVSRRDIPFILAQKSLGATTVASTMIIAEMAGVKVFATGGIGGVHRGAQDDMDISADLEELAMTQVAVICAGVKSILDIGLTMEYLETKGVPVIGHNCDKLPAFYARESAFGVDYDLSSAHEMAEALNIKWQLGMTGGALIANPVPEADAIPSAEIDQFIAQAVEEADAQNVKGKKITPFLLGRIVELTEGRSLKANIALVLNNAKLAANVAIEYQKMQ